MTKIMTPSAEFRVTTARQVDKAVANYRALLEKHSPEFNSEAVQEVLGQAELAGEQFAVFRRRVEAVSNMIVRRVKVNRSRTPQQMLDATGRRQYTDRKVVDAMPRGDGEEVEVCFFKPDASAYQDGLMSDEEMERQCELRGMESADPYSLAAVNEADPAFADQMPNATHWKDANGNWCYAAFGRWFVDGRGVRIHRICDDWYGRWFVAGVRKYQKKPLVA